MFENETSLLSARVAEVTLQPGATLRWFLGGGRRCGTIQRRFVFRLHEGARLELLGAFFGHHQRRLEFDLRIEHLAPRTTSYAASRRSLGSVPCELRENIHMFPKAKDANGRVDGHVLMLSRDAVANIVPDLEIEQRNVRASHGATIGQVSPDQLFYLATRGMDRGRGRAVHCGGFLSRNFFKLSDGSSAECFSIYFFTHLLMSTPTILCRLDDISDGGAKRVVFDGQSFAVFRHGKGSMPLAIVVLIKADHYQMDFWMEMWLSVLARGDV